MAGIADLMIECPERGGGGDSRRLLFKKTDIIQPEPVAIQRADGPTHVPYHLPFRFYIDETFDSGKLVP